VAASFLRFHPKIGTAAAASSSAAAKASPPSAAAAAAAAAAGPVAAAATAAYAAAVAKTDASLPPSLRALARVWRDVSAAVRTALLAGELPAASAAEAGSAPAAAAEKPLSVLREELTKLQQANMKVSYKVKGGAVEAKGPAAGCSVPRSVQKELEKLTAGRAGLPLFLTEGM
jgi:enamine deaminase RidA (YjgF/YER057c/UK114 family)